MTLQKAIEILQANFNAKPPGVNHDYFDAIKLGIEATKHYLESSHYACGILLPGETRETEE